MIMTVRHFLLSLAFSGVVEGKGEETDKTMKMKGWALGICFVGGEFEELEFSTSWK